MDANQAFRELGKWEYFFRALKTVREVLEEGQKAVESAERARTEEAQAKAEVERIVSGSANLKDQLKKLQKQYADKTAAFESQMQAELDGTMAKLQTQADAKKAELIQVEEMVLQAGKKHESLMAEYAERESTALRTIKDLETKLAAAQKAYNDFKAKL